MIYQNNSIQRSYIYHMLREDMSFFKYLASSLNIESNSFYYSETPFLRVYLSFLLYKSV